MEKKRTVTNGKIVAVCCFVMHLDGQLFLIREMVVFNARECGVVMHSIAFVCVCVSCSDSCLLNALT